MKPWGAGLLFLLGLSAVLRAQDTSARNPAVAALEDACEAGDLAKVQTLIDQGTPVDGQPDKFEFTPLMLAAYAGHVDIINYLIGKKAILDYPDREGSTALLHACWENHTDCALALIDAGTHVNFGSNAGRYPLMYAAMKGNDAIVTDLIAHKAKLDADCNQGPAVLWAAANDKFSTVKLLGDAGANLILGPVNDKNSYTILAMAAAVNDLPMIDYLLGKGVSVDLRGADGATPLMAAAEHNFPEAVNHLLDKGAGIDLQDNFGETALTHARDAATVQALLAHRPNLELKNKLGRTALMVAAGRNQILEVVRALVEGGADINATDNQGETALTLAGDVTQAAIVDYLKGKGALRTDVHVIDKGDPPQPLPPQRTWALAVAAFYTQRDGLNPKVLGGNVTSIASEKEVLKRDWGITNKASLLKELDDLRDHGHHAEYQRVGLALSQMSDDQFNLALASYADKAAKIKAMRASYLKWKDRSGLGWDLVRSANLVNLGYAIGYLKEPEAWDRLMGIARRTKAGFSSWQELSDNFLDGREIWAGERNPNFDACAHLLLNPKDPNSPWNQNPWTTDLGAEGQ